MTAKQTVDDVSGKTRRMQRPRYRSKKALSERALIALAAGYGALALGTIVAHKTPATSYEPSIYNGTPLVFWIAICIALLVSVIVAFEAETRSASGLSLGLAGLSITIVAALPLIRGYYYLGEADAMTHLGLAIDIAAGAVNPIDILYPAVHLLSIAISAATGLELRRALMFIAIVFIVVYLVFIPMLVRLITDSDHAVTIATFAACLLLPVNVIAVHLQVHPSSQALFFLPVLLYLFFIYTVDPSRQYLALTLVTGIAFVLIHPLHAGNLVVFLGTIALVQYVERFSAKQTVARNLLLTALFSAVFLGWVAIAALDQLIRIASIVLTSVLVDTGETGAVTQQAASLSTIGSGLDILFVKLFLVRFVFCVLAGVLMLSALIRLYRSSIDPISESSWIIAYLTTGFVPIAGLFAFLLVGGISSIAFRYLGFMLVIATIVGAIALSRAGRLLSTRLSRPTASTFLSVLFIAFLAMSLLVVYPSPYIHLPTGHVPESQVEGYETAFETQDDEIPYLHLRSLPYRYSDAIYGEAAFDRPDHYGGAWQTELADGFADGELPAQYDESHYLVVTQRDRINETIVYEGLRFDENDFAYLETEPGIHRVQSSEGLDRYLVTPDRTGGSDEST